MIYPRCKKSCDDLIGGDIRAHEQPLLSSLHTLFLQEHNRIATGLRNQLKGVSIGKNKLDELLYQEARKIVAAELQTIVYNEFLPVVVGKAF